MEVKVVKPASQEFLQKEEEGLLEQMRKNKELVVIMCVLVFLALMKEKVIEFVKLISEARKSNESNEYSKIYFFC